jgi:WD40 repeat protein
MKRILIFLCILYIFSSSPCLAAKRYSIRKTFLKNGRIIVTVMINSTNQSVWKRSLSSLWCIKWSRNGKYLAVIGEKNPHYTYRLYLWNVGHWLRSYSNIEPFEHSEAIIDLEWSKDSQRFLIRAPYTQGQGSIGEGRLWSVRLRDMKSFRISESAAAFKWVDARHVWIREYIQNKDGNTGAWKDRQRIHAVLVP